MAWQDEMVDMLRVMLNDLDEPYTYTDQRLQKIICVSGSFVLTDAKGLFTQNFSCNSYTLTITPDPTLPETRDDNFINLTLLKAGCFVDGGNARRASKKGFSIREFGSSIDTRGVVSAALAILEKGWCKNYEESLFDYILGNANACSVILGPFRTVYNAYYGGGAGYNYGSSDPFGNFNGANRRN